MKRSTQFFLFFILATFFSCGNKRSEGNDNDTAHNSGNATEITTNPKFIAHRDSLIELGGIDIPSIHRVAYIQELPMVEQEYQFCSYDYNNGTTRKAMTTYIGYSADLSKLLIGETDSIVTMIACTGSGGFCTMYRFNVVHVKQIEENEMQVHVFSFKERSESGYIGTTWEESPIPIEDGVPDVCIMAEIDFHGNLIRRLSPQHPLSKKYIPIDERAPMIVYEEFERTSES